MGTLRERLRELRGAAGLKQDAIAARMGISQSFLSKIENGQADLTPELLGALQNALGVGAFAIVGGTEWAHLDPAGELVTVHGEAGVQWLAYFASALTGLNEAQRQAVFAQASEVRQVCEALRAFLYEPSHYTDPIRNPEISAERVYSIDRRQVSQSDVAIVSCMQASFGAGQEIEIATGAGVPIVLLASETQKVSRMVLGSYARTRVVRYADPMGFRVQLREALTETFNELVQRRHVAESGLGSRVKNARASRSLSVGVVARTAGISEAALLALESGDCTLENPSVSCVRRLAEILGTSAAYLLDGIMPHREDSSEILRNSKASLESFALATGLTLKKTTDLWNEYCADYEMQRVAVAEARAEPLTEDDWKRRAGQKLPGQRQLFVDEQ